MPSEAARQLDGLSAAALVKALVDKFELPPTETMLARMRGDDE